MSNRTGICMSCTSTLEVREITCLIIGSSGKMMNKQTHTAQKHKHGHVAAFYCEPFRAYDNHGAIVHSKEIVARLNSVENEKIKRIAVLGYN